jgi:hypothetical protein
LLKPSTLLPCFSSNRTSLSARDTLEGHPSLHRAEPLFLDSTPTFVLLWLVLQAPNRSQGAEQSQEKELCFRSLLACLLTSSENTTLCQFPYLRTELLSFLLAILPWQESSLFYKKYRSSRRYVYWSLVGSRMYLFR